MTSLTSYLLVILIVGIILLTITYTTDYINIPKMPKFLTRNYADSSSSDIEHEKKYKQPHHNQPNVDISNFLIETNESDNINNKLFSGVDDFQMTETTGNAIADALRNI